jgi:hypothetical protein
MPLICTAALASDCLTMFRSCQLPGTVQYPNCIPGYIMTHSAHLATELLPPRFASTGQIKTGDIMLVTRYVACERLAASQPYNGNNRASAPRGPLLREASIQVRPIQPIVAALGIQAASTPSMGCVTGASSRVRAPDVVTCRDSASLSRPARFSPVDACTGAMSSRGRPFFELSL